MQSQVSVVHRAKHIHASIWSTKAEHKKAAIEAYYSPFVAFDDPLVSARGLKEVTAQYLFLTLIPDISTRIHSCTSSSTTIVSRWNTTDVLFDLNQDKNPQNGGMVFDNAQHNNVKNPKSNSTTTIINNRDRNISYPINDGLPTAWTVPQVVAGGELFHSPSLSPVLSTPARTTASTWTPPNGIGPSSTSFSQSPLSPSSTAHLSPYPNNTVFHRMRSPSVSYGSERVVIDATISFHIVPGVWKLPLRVISTFEFGGVDGRLVKHEDIWSIRDSIGEIIGLGWLYESSRRIFGQLSSIVLIWFFTFTGVLKKSV